MKLWMRLKTAAASEKVRVRSRAARERRDTSRRTSERGNKSDELPQQAIAYARTLVFHSLESLYSDGEATSLPWKRNEEATGLGNTMREASSNPTIRIRSIKPRSLWNSRPISQSSFSTRPTKFSLLADKQILLRQYANILIIESEYLNG